ncbi:aminopeptidase PepB, partial [Vibrio genomosp. F10 str. 9ZD137]
MSTQMSLYISHEPAQPQWGDKAILSFSDSGATVHTGEGHELDVIQRAARKLDSQGVKAVSLQGKGWDLEKIWAFQQGYRSAKKLNSIEWSPLEADNQAELEARIITTDWTRDIINKPAEEVAPRQLATMAAEFIKSVAPKGTVTVKIVKDKDLLAENWQGIYAVGRGSERTSAMLQLDYNPTGDDNAPVFACLVGKGITFDSGGYSIKPGQFMTSMKADMGGAGTI